MRRKLSKSIIFLVIICIPAIFYLLRPGFYEPHDLHHIADIYQMVRAISSGQIPPRLGPDFSFGLGYPLFNFYYVLPFYLGAIFFSFVGSLIWSFKLVMITGVILSVLGMNLLLREFVGKFPAFVGSILFLYTPYRAVQVYVRGAIGEVICIALLPFVAWSFVKVIKKPSEKTIAISSIITALFILSHNYLSFMSLPLIFAILLPLILGVKSKVKQIASLALVLILSLALSAYWWVPAIFEQNLLIATTPFPLIDHFPFLKQLIMPSWGYGASLWGSGDGLSFQIGLVNLFVIMSSLGMVVFARKKIPGKSRPMMLILLVVFLMLVFFMNIRSLPLWKLVPFYNFIQFPWRLLFYTTFVTSLLVGFLLDSFKNPKRVVIGLTIIMSSIILTQGYFKPDKLVYKNDNAYLNRFFANRSIEGQTNGMSQEYLGYSEDYLLLPKWVDERPVTLPMSKVEVQGDALITNIQDLNPVNWKADIVAESETIAIFNAYYFPGWEAKNNNIPIPVKTGKTNGKMEVELSKGINKLEFKWTETPLRKTSDLASLTTLLAVVLIYFKSDIKRRFGGD